MSAQRSLKPLLPANWKRKVREYLVSLQVTHLCGPKAIRLLGNEAAVTCVVKNGEYYIQSFIKHYSQMGFRHIFFLDNGSTDQTISLATTYRNVSVFQSKLPINGRQTLFKAYLAQRCVAGGWCLDADIDEFFDYPFSDVVALRDFLVYLNRKHYTAVMTQLLDMFPEKPLADLETKNQEEGLNAVYQYYDISELRKIRYRLSELGRRYGHENELANGDAELYFGGIRNTLYGNDCLLTKHSLFLSGRGLELFPHVHFVNRARLADISCVMLHYKLTSTAFNIALQNKGAFLGTSKGYGDFIDFLLNKSKYQIKQSTSRKFRSAKDLVESGFLFMSEEYRKYVRAFSRQI